MTRKKNEYCSLLILYTHLQILYHEHLTTLNEPTLGEITKNIMLWLASVALTTDLVI